jgi:hypothetical protein
MRCLTRLALLLLAACARGPGGSPMPLNQDTSIVFPRFLEEKSTTLGQPGENYNLDGASLQALMVAVNDFFPPAPSHEACLSKPSAHRFLITRRGDIIFIEIYADVFSCDWRLLGLDYGARYAISLDGRILRRLAIGEPDGSPPPTPDDGGSIDPTDYSDRLGFTSFGPATAVRLPRRKDAGPEPDQFPSSQALDGGAAWDGGLPPSP